MEKEDYKVSLKEIRENLYELRNFEISHLWQRSVFFICSLGHILFWLWIFSVRID